jgi:glycosyltransferase involved in cell wall biosynthesis
MNCFNSAQYLREAIDSVYAQTDGDWAIVFWDNASTDESAAIARSYDQRLRYFRSERTAPLYAARRLAMEQCRGDYIGFLDCDDVWLPRKLELQLPVFQANPGVGLVHSNAFVMDERGQRRLRHVRPRPSGAVLRELVRDYHLCLPSILISRAICERLALQFDAAFHFSGDADLFMRLAANADVGYLFEPTAMYREHHGSASLASVHRMRQESEMILARLAETCPGFFENYGVEVAAWRNNIEMTVIRTEWRLGRHHELFALARGHAWALAASLALAVGTFVPPRAVERCRYLLKRA